MANPPPTMMAVTVGHGGPDQIEIRDDWLTPRPGPGEVLVQVSAASLNNTDIWTRRGDYGTSEDSDPLVGWRGVPLTSEDPGRGRRRRGS